MKRDFSKIVACPECIGRLSEIVGAGSELVGFCCQACRIVFPVMDDILVLLPSRARSYQLEYSLIENMRQVAVDCSPEGVGKCIQRTLSLLEQSKNKTTWEWEDEKHWTMVYDEETVALITKNWNDRIWQREFLVQRLIEQTALRGKTILDVGAGEGQNFRILLSKYCDEETLYIAADISLSALKLNRSRNLHDNSISILCSADYLPVQKQTVDILCYFGVLHHTERKEQNICSHKELVKKGGLILLHEPLVRPSPPLGPLKPKDCESAHEERIEGRQLMSAIKESDLEVVASQLLHTIFFTGMMRLFGSIMVNNKSMFKLISGLDKVFMTIFGGIIAYFRAGVTMLLLKRH